jgi:acid phosphatase (class A)
MKAGLRRGAKGVLALLPFGIAAGGLLLPSAGAQVANSGAAAADTLAHLPPGFLPRDQLPDSLALLPPPPASQSEAFARDEAAWRAAAADRAGSRWTLASSDADLSFPHAAGTFSCAAGVAISKEATPRTYALLGRSLIDVGLSTYRAKIHYNRTRPFVMHRARTCFPKDEPSLRHDGSYPSGHSAAGWGWALILAELVPGRADDILQRGRDFGQSRIVCGVHWQSDVDAGRVIAAATVARLHADPAFRHELDVARRELAGASAPGAPDVRRCAAESAALRR